MVERKAAVSVATRDQRLGQSSTSIYCVRAASSLCQWGNLSAVHPRGYCAASGLPKKEHPDTMPLPFLSAESQQQGLPESLTILRMILLLY